MIACLTSVRADSMSEEWSAQTVRWFLSANIVERARPRQLTLRFHKVVRTGTQ